MSSGASATTIPSASSVASRSSVRDRTGAPARSAYCFGVAFAKRDPPPAAATMIQVRIARARASVLADALVRRLADVFREKRFHRLVERELVLLVVEAVPLVVLHDVRH